MPQPIRFRLIDQTTLSDHARLGSEDRCYFLLEYTSDKNYTFSGTNSLISNLKKKPSTSQKSGYWYKGKAISDVACFLRGAIAAEWLATGTLVPVPPSKAPGHPEFDDRMERVCRGIGSKADVRMLVRQTTSMEAAHESAKTGSPRPTIEQLVNSYEIDESLALPEPVSIAILDDVLTAGTHFKAMQRVLEMRFPSAEIFGIFIARRIFPPQDGEMIFAPAGD